tara:strand:+ start:70 stop:255 length:186 start_codon:yes stop_codon:yes gene_type:complete
MLQYQLKNQHQNNSQKQQMNIIEKRINHKEKQMSNMRTEIKQLLQRAKTPSQKKIAKRQAT